MDKPLSKKRYWKYGLKKFLFYVIIGLCAANIPMLYISVGFGAPAVILTALLISIADTSQLKRIDSGERTNHHIVFSSSHIKAIAVIVIIAGIYVLFIANSSLGK